MHHPNYAKFEEYIKNEKKIADIIELKTSNTMPFWEKSEFTGETEEHQILVDDESLDQDRDSQLQALQFERIPARSARRLRH